MSSWLHIEGSITMSISPTVDYNYIANYLKRLMEDLKLESQAVFLFNGRKPTENMDLLANHQNLDLGGNGLTVLDNISIRIMGRSPEIEIEDAIQSIETFIHDLISTTGFVNFFAIRISLDGKEVMLTSIEKDSDIVYLNREPDYYGKG